MKSLSTRVSHLIRLSRFTNFHSMKQIANGIFLSKLIYGIAVWGGANISYLKILQRMQNKAARAVCKLSVYTPIETLLKTVKWLSIRQLIFFHSLALFHQILTNQEPTCIYDNIDRNYSNYRTLTRAAISNM